MNNPLGVSPSKGIREPHEVKKNLLTSVGVEPTISGLDLPLPLSFLGRFKQPWTCLQMDLRNLSGSEKQIRKLKTRV